MTRVEERRGGRIVEREESLVDPTKLTVRQIAQAVRVEVLTLEQAYVELARRKAEGESLDADAVPRGAR